MLWPFSACVAAIRKKPRNSVSIESCGLEATSMGAELSKPAEPNPCAGEMETYVKCVEAKTAESGGLRDGEECEKESEAYRECRRKVKKLKAAVKK